MNGYIKVIEGNVKRSFDFVRGDISRINNSLSELSESSLKMDLKFTKDISDAKVSMQNDFSMLQTEIQKIRQNGEIRFIQRKVKKIK